ncbi:heparan-alpha-glucosaminide N-acetyltransferase [Aureimonas sp. AU12]|uniref:heparan-alpha-glucosaminide N-acetyltransferase n=1 Tax=Aureimonas sp. AU12 TaxID=1638161 RepID=UPI000784C4CD|nr:heparan-alpha-glucosaminide N-acetyltransferase [Aureimonas sp. AU12]
MDLESKPQATRRIELLDILRGVALIAMATYHFTWDLEFFGHLARGTASEGGWRLFARGIASSFLVLVGIGLVLAHGRQIRWRPFWRRLAQVAAGAAAITVATWVATPQGFVFFGILHQIAVASLIGLLVLRLPFPATLLLGIGVILLPQIVSTAAFDTRWLAWIGLAESPPLSNDFVPVFPWTGAVLIGMGLAQLAVRVDLPSRLARWNDRLHPLRRLGVLGRHSLLFYLLHQPLLIGVVALATYVVPPDQTAVFRESCRLTCEDGRDAAYCARYCGCVESDLAGKNLMQKLLREQLTDADQTSVGETVNLCSVFSEP